MKSEYAVADFGRSQGLEGLSLQPLGHVRLGQPDGNWIALEEHADDLLVNVVTRAPHLTTEAMVLALQGCEARQLGLDRVFQVGTQGTGADTVLVLVTRLAADRVTGTDIGMAVEASLRWVDRWSAEVSASNGRA